MAKVIYLQVKYKSMILHFPNFHYTGSVKGMKENIMVSLLISSVAVVIFIMFPIPFIWAFGGWQNENN